MEFLEEILVYTYSYTEYSTRCTTPTGSNYLLDRGRKPSTSPAGHREVLLNQQCTLHVNLVGYSCFALCACVGLDQATQLHPTVVESFPSGCAGDAVLYAVWTM